MAHIDSSSGLFWGLGVVYPHQRVKCHPMLSVERSWSGYSESLGQINLGNSG